MAKSVLGTWFSHNKDDRMSICIVKDYTGLLNKEV